MKYGRMEISSSYGGYTKWAKFVGLFCDPVVRNGWTECDEPPFEVDTVYYDIGNLGLVLGDYGVLQSLVAQKQEELRDLIAREKELFNAIAQNIEEPTICCGYFLNWSDEDFEIKKGKSV